MLIVGAYALACTPRPRELVSDAWSPLQYKTGWILLGELDPRAAMWVTQLKYKFPISPGEPSILIPPEGSVIEMISEDPVVIIDFRTRGEENRFMSPAGRTISPADWTGITLQTGERVIIKSVQQKDILDDLQDVWARIEPVESAARYVPPLAKSKDAVEKALIEAVRADRVETVRALLAGGADPDAIARGTHDEDTALTMACKSGDLELVAMLLGAGANPNLRQSGGNWAFTPLMVASARGHVEIVQRLLDAGAGLEARQGLFRAQDDGVDTRPRSALYYAILNGQTETVRRLILAGAVIGPTDLGTAIINGHVDIVRLLLRADANPRWIFSSGLSVLDEARRSPEPTRAQMVAEVRRFLDGPPRQPEILVR